MVRRLSPGVGRQGAQRAKSGDPTPKGEKVEVFDVCRYETELN